MSESHWFRSRQKSAARSRWYGVRAVLLLAATAAIVGATCGAVLALAPPTDSPIESPAPPARVAVLADAETSHESGTTTTTIPAPATDEYPDYRPDPVPSSTSRAQSIGAKAQASLASAGLRLARAVEFTFPDGTGPVFDIMLQSESASARGFVRIFIQKTLRHLDASDMSVKDELAGSQIEIPDYGVEEVGLVGASRAYCVTGPFGSYVQIVAELTNGLTINVCSESGELKGMPPVDRAGVEGLISVLAGEL